MATRLKNARGPFGLGRVLLVYAGCLFAGLSLQAQQPGPVQKKEQPARPAMTAEQQKLVEDHERYVVDAKTFRQEGKLREAIEAGEKMLAIERKLLGNDHANVAASLEFLAELNEEREDYPAACKARQEVLEVKIRLYGERHWQVIDARLDLAHEESLRKMDPAQRGKVARATRLLIESRNLQRQGKEREALDSAQEATELLSEVFGKNHPDYAIALGALATLCKGMGNHARAEQLYEEALPILKDSLGEKHPLYAMHLYLLATVLMSKADYSKAEHLYVQTMRIREEVLGNTNAEYAQSLWSLAGLYEETGEYKKAEPLYQRAIGIYKKVYGEKDSGYASMLDSLAVLYKVQGDYARAEPLYQKALQVTKETQGDKAIGYANRLLNIAELYREMGDSSRAEPLIWKAEEIYEKAGGIKNPGYADLMNNLGVLYNEMGDNVRAEVLHRAALELRRQRLGEKHPDYALSLTNLADVYTSTGAYSKAEPLLRQALEIFRQTGGEKHHHYATAMKNLGDLYACMGDYGKAEPLLRQALESYKQALGDQHPDYANNVMNLAGLYISQGNPGAASPLVQQSLAIYEKLLEETFDVLGERQRLAFLTKLRSALDTSLSLSSPIQTSPSVLYAHVLSWKGAVAARKAEERLARDQPELEPLVLELTSTQGRLAHLAFMIPQPDQRAAWLRQIEEQREQKEDLESRLAHESAVFRRLRLKARVGPREVAKTLPADSVLIDFLEYTHLSPSKKGSGRLNVEERMVAFILRPQKDPVMVNLGPATPIRQAVTYWRQALQDGRETAFRSAGRNLFHRVWQPLQPYISKTRLVLISPDGPLCKFPFAALPDERPGSYLIEDVAIGYVTSGRQVVQIFGDDPQSPASGLLAIGGIDYDADPGPVRPDTRAALPSLPKGEQTRAGFRPLPGTQAEVQNIARTFQDRFGQERPPLLLTGSEPTGARLQEELSPSPGKPPWRYLHLASHGFFAPPSEVSALRPTGEERWTAAFALAVDQERQVIGRDPMLLSGLVLAGAGRPRAGDTGILTAEEVAGLDLRGMDLAVLSACETGLGEVAGGEGVLGLQRAFQAAGARTLVTSLWKVDDAATALLMEEFYANLWQKKMPKLEALRQAQLTVLHHPELVEQRRRQMAKGDGAGGEPGPTASPGTGKDRSPPSLWAAFILSGDIR